MDPTGAGVILQAPVIAPHAAALVGHSGLEAVQMPVGIGLAESMIQHNAEAARVSYDAHQDDLGTTPTGQPINIGGSALLGRKHAPDRRPLRFWQPFNDWWRAELERLGRRPTSQEIGEWYAHSAGMVWGEAKPTLQETRVHAKCLRSLPLVRDYFRNYRAKKRAKGSDGSGLYDGDEGDGDTDDNSGGRRHKRSQSRKRDNGFDDIHDPAKLAAMSMAALGPVEMMQMQQAGVMLPQQFWAGMDGQGDEYTRAVLMQQHLSAALYQQQMAAAVAAQQLTGQQFGVFPSQDDDDDDEEDTDPGDGNAAANAPVDAGTEVASAAPATSTATALAPGAANGGADSGSGGVTAAAQDAPMDPAAAASMPVSIAPIMATANGTTGVEQPTQPVPNVQMTAASSLLAGLEAQAVADSVGFMSAVANGHMQQQQQQEHDALLAMLQHDQQPEQEQPQPGEPAQKLGISQQESAATNHQLGNPSASDAATGSDEVPALAHTQTPEGQLVQQPHQQQDEFSHLGMFDDHGSKMQVSMQSVSSPMPAGFNGMQQAVFAGHSLVQPQPQQQQQHQHEPTLHDVLAVSSATEAMQAPPVQLQNPHPVGLDLSAIGPTMSAPVQALQQQQQQGLVLEGLTVPQAPEQAAATASVAGAAAGLTAAGEQVDQPRPPEQDEMPLLNDADMSGMSADMLTAHLRLVQEELLGKRELLKRSFEQLRRTQERLGRRERKLAKEQQRCKQYQQALAAWQASLVPLADPATQELYTAQMQAAMAAQAAAQGGMVQQQ